MSSQPSADPIARLLAVHTETRRHLQAIADADIHALPAAIAWLDGPARIANDIMEQRLSPALIESMAGSDAVCLRGMTGGLAQDRADLDRRWHQSVRPVLKGPAKPATRGVISAWADDYLAWLKCADEELIPMAQRLLDDTALDELAGDCARLACSA